MRVTSVCGWILAVLTTGFALDLVVDPAATGADDAFTSVAQALAYAQSAPLAKRASGAAVTIYLRGGAVIRESIHISPATLDPDIPLIITSDPDNPAVVMSGAGALGKGAATAGSSYTIYNRGNVTLSNTTYDGSGSGKSSIVVWADNGRYSTITIRNCTIRNGDENGLFIGGAAGSGFSDILVEGCTVHNNRRDGVNTWGEQNDCIQNITLRDCVFHNNHGEAGYVNPSGSGCVLGMVSGGLIEYCTAYENGKNNTNSAGPVGIWTYASSNVVIQFCEAYNNRSSGGDGGGFDIDGGSKNCVIQYCYSHGNDGPGYLLAQYAGADAMTNNTIRYNISENDGQRNYGSIVLWSTGSSGGINGAQIYGNTVYAGQGSRGCVNILSGGMSAISMRNNIFMSTGAPVWQGGTGGITLEANCYYGGTYSVSDPRQVTQNPLLVSPGNSGVVGARNLHTLTGYYLQPASPCIDAGVSISGSGERDFFDNGVPRGNAFDIGAHEFETSTAAYRPTHGRSHPPGGYRYTTGLFAVGAEEQRAELFSLNGVLMGRFGTDPSLSSGSRAGSLPRGFHLQRISTGDATRHVVAGMRVE